MALRTLRALLLAHEVDLAVMGHTVPGDDLVVTPLRPNRLVVIAPPHHRLVGRPSISIEELRDEGFIIREPGSGTRASMERFFDQHGFTVQAVMELSDNSAIKQAVAAGIGLAVISESAVETALCPARCPSRRACQSAALRLSDAAGPVRRPPSNRGSR